MMRTASIFFPVLFLLIFSGCDRNRVHIDKIIDRNGRKIFQVETRNGLYLYDSAAGRFASVFDSEHVDWVGHRDDSAGYPAGAAGYFRFLPDLVSGFPESHSGNSTLDLCRSTWESPNRIRSVSIKGNMEWTWTFFNNYAVMAIIKSDSINPYWFLYEGIPGGEYKPYRQYWGTSLGGPWNDIPDLYFNEPFIHHFQWIYFGDENINRVFFMAQAETDSFPDYFAYLGNTREGVISPDGMVVAGFGRGEDAKPYFIKPGRHFIIGFYDQQIKSPKVHKKISAYLEHLLKQIK